jgi:hypothetical protein
MSCSINYDFESTRDWQIKQSLTMLYRAKLLIENNPQHPVIEYLNRFPMRESKNNESVFFEPSIDREPKSYKTLTDPLPSFSWLSLFKSPVFLTLSDGVAHFYGKTIEAFIDAHDKFKSFTPEYRAFAKEAALVQLREQGFQIGVGHKM